METLLNFIPGGILTIVLGIFAAIRVLITIYDSSVKATATKEDDKKWAEIRGTLWFIMIEKTIYYLAGIQLPAKKE
jgi:hypothetical protein